MNNPLVFIDPTGMARVGADGLKDDQWLDQTRKDGGYWEEAKEMMKNGKNKQAKDNKATINVVSADRLPN